MPGGGVITAEASELLVELAELSQIPVLPTLMGWGTIPDDHPLYAGMTGSSEPGDIAGALAWATETAERERRPVLVEILIEREANAAMGAAIDAIEEFDPADADPGAAAANVPAVTGS